MSEAFTTATISEFHPTSDIRAAHERMDANEIQSDLEAYIRSPISTPTIRSARR